MVFGRVFDAVKEAIDKQTGKYAEDAAKRLVQIINEGFENEGYPTLKWAPLAKATIRIKKSKGYRMDILTATWEMRSSVSYEQIGDKSYRVSIDDEKAVLHEFGTSVMPARPIMRPAVQQLRQEMPDVEAIEVSGTSRVIK